jgi:MFS family permease
MLELYFLIYRIPKMMTRLARERNRSAIAWSLIGVGAWIAAELVVGFTGGLIYAVGVELWGWPARSSGFSFLVYVLALVGALVSVTIVSRILTRKPRDESFLPPPPPPQEFRDPEGNHGGQ